MMAPAVLAPKTPSAPPGHDDAGSDQGGLQGDDAGAALVVDGEPGGGRGRRRGSGCGGRRPTPVSPSRRAVASSTVPDAGMPLLLWVTSRTLWVAVPKIPSAPPRSVQPMRSSACWSDTTAGPRLPRRKPIVAVADRAAGRGRLRCRVAAQRQGGRCLRVDGPGDAEALGLLERLQGAFGAPAEDAVDTAGHGHAGVDQRLLQLLHLLPDGAAGERAGRGRGRRRRPARQRSRARRRSPGRRRR